MPNPLERPYADLKVVELATDPGGEMTGYLLAGMGADVIKVEPPEGSPTRAVGPWLKGEEGPDDSLAFWYYNSNKRSAVVDYRTKDGMATLEALLAGADIFLCTLQPRALRSAGIDHEALSRRFPNLIVLSVTPFGLTGPWADYKSSELVGLAAGGPLFMCGYDDHAIPPILPGGNQAYHVAASFAHKALLVALIDRQMNGGGQVVDVSMHEGCAVTVELGNPYWFYPKALVERQTCRHAQPVRTQPAIFECADGKWVYFVLVVAEPKPFANLVAWMDSKGMAADLTDEAYQDFAYRQAHYAHVQGVVECFFLVHDAETMFHEGQERELPIAVISAPEELFEDPHNIERGFFVEVEHEGIGTFKYPGAPYQFSAFTSVPRTRAPKLGEHTNEVLGALAGEAVGAS
ncbi:MAG: CoA transferase [Alphaproteobacteria bacterium]|nr:CoA transferase [Alphaproteobacteria bacterium]